MPKSKREDQQRAAPQIPATPGVSSEQQQHERHEDRYSLMLLACEAIDDVPAIEPQMGAVTDGIVDLPEASYAFVVLPDANAGACKRGSSSLP